MQLKKIKKDKKNIILKCLGFFLLTIGSIMLIFHYLNIKKLNDNNNLKIDNFFKEKIVDNTDISYKNNISSKTSNYDYIAILEIPTISLKRGLVSPNSYYNNVKYNIQILENSDMPDVLNGNFILASHSGLSYIAFFKNLDKLKENDKVYVYYNGFKYEYSIYNNYTAPKNGKIEINRDYKKSTITLITCKKNTIDTQIVYIGYMTDKEQY